LLTKKSPTLTAINIKAKENLALQSSLRSKGTIDRKNHHYLFTHDPLEEIANYYLAIGQLEKSLQLAKNKNNFLVILHLTLNDFEQVKHIYGHTIKDDVLCIIVKRLKQVLDKDAHLSPLSEHEYIASLTIEKSNFQAIEKNVGKLKTLISRPVNINTFRIKVGLSVGMAAYPVHGDKVGVLLDIAEKRAR